jgi:gluconate 2-dehydrogenase gamma chain
MSETSRRELLRQIGVTMSLAGMGQGLVAAQDSAHVHRMVAEDKSSGPYRPKCFDAHEYETLRKLAALIVPADEHSPGALEAGAPEFIDLLASTSDELAANFTGGLAWLDAKMRHRHGAAFLDAPEAAQTAMLDLIAYRKNDSPELGPGIRFFTWVRNMTVDAFVTSKAGMDYLGFMGNGAVSKFSVPEEAVRYAIERCPV